ncbi:MAG: Release factor glutamine methyltransferase [Desulfovibrio sp.]
MLLHELLTTHTDRLEKAGVDSPRLSAEVLLAHGMGISRNDLIKKLLVSPDTCLPSMTVEMAEQYIARREAGEPVAYITGVKEFYGRDFAVSPATLIPRPDTETVIEEALSFAARCTNELPKTFIDLGTGSGAIATTLALELPTWRGMAVDISDAALSIAKKNAETLGAKNLQFALCDFLGSALPQGPYGMIVSNPPYVSEDEYETLSREVTGYEPKNALVPPFAASTGLEHLLSLIDTAERLVAPGGLLLLEMGCTQGDPLMQKAKSMAAWSDCRIIPDLAGLPRVFHAVRGNA